jgi:hypothetical protein
MSMTAGIGSWTYAQFEGAVRLAKHKDGTDLCFFMPKFTETDFNAAALQNIYAFLKSKPIVDTPQRGTFCP